MGSNHLTAAKSIEDLDGPQAGTGGHSHHTDPIIQGGRDAGHGAAVVVVIIAIATLLATGALDAVHGLEDVEIRMVQVDAGVDDRDVHVDPVIVPVDIGKRAEIGVDPVHTARQGLQDGMGVEVWLDIGHVGIIGKRIGDGGRHARGEALQGEGVAVPEREAVSAGQRPGQPRRIGYVIVKNHDVLPGNHTHGSEQDCSLGRGGVRPAETSPHRQPRGEKDDREETGNNPRA